MARRKPPAGSEKDEAGRNLTLRQIEVIRAIMVTGTISGAAKLLGVSAPGISRLMKYTEDSLDLRLFDRANGRFVPTAQAKTIFDLLDGVYQKVGDLGYALAALRKGGGQRLSLGSVPSISNVMLPRAVARLRHSFPELELEINIVKIEEAIDLLLLGRAEIVALSSKLEHGVIEAEPLARGHLLCIVPQSSPLAALDRISPQEMARHPLIGIDPKDPYGAIMASVFSQRGLEYDMSIRARFGTTVCRLVGEGLGIAIIDEFTVAYDTMPNIKALEIDADTMFQTYVAYRNDRPLSVFAERLIAELRGEMDRWSARGSGAGGDRPRLQIAGAPRRAPGP